MYFQKRGFTIPHSYIECHGCYEPDMADKVIEILIPMFLSKEVDEIHVAYTHFKSVLHHVPVIEKLLNIECQKDQKFDYLLEPDGENILCELIPRYLSMKMRLILLESFTSEHSARMIAMRTATDNAQELVKHLILQKNKTRQASITKEIIEIVSAAEALRV